MKASATPIAMRNVIISLLLLFAAMHDAQAQPAAPPGSIVGAIANVVPINVDGGPANRINRPFVTIDICAPGSSTDCRTIDHVLLSTDSMGLRIFSSALKPSLPLPQQVLGDGTPLGECKAFSDGVIWGSVKLADVLLGGELAKSVPIQVIGDPQFSSMPAACSNAAPSLNSVEALAGNGVLGIGPFLQDCGSGCVKAASNALWYYACTAAGCRPTAAPLEKQVQNPVAFFAIDNNGAAITLPPVIPPGARSITGTLVFGIGTQTNNALGSATVLALNPGGYFTTVYKGQAYTRSFIDANADGIYFLDSQIAPCTVGRADLYCPSSPLLLSAMLQGASGETQSAELRVADVIMLNAQHPDFAVLAGMAGSDTDPMEFVWGLPFFFGKTVFIGIEGKNTPGGPGPYYALPNVGKQ